MKILKAYGKGNDINVYLNGEKKNINEIENSLFFDNISNFGYGISNQLVIFENEYEKDLIDSQGLKNFEAIEVPYSVFKGLQQLPGAGYLTSEDYNAETKTIKVMCLA